MKIAKQRHSFVTNDFHMRKKRAPPSEADAPAPCPFSLNGDGNQARPGRVGRLERLQQRGARLAPVRHAGQSLSIRVMIKGCNPNGEPDGQLTRQPQHGAVL